MQRMWTIGHSTRPWDVFVAMLQEAGISAVADVRRFAGSRRYPQFSGDAMAKTLPPIGIDYVAMPDLGGRRRPRPDSPNTAWRSEAFRGYADYMDTAEYAQARARLAELAARKPAAVLCAEAVWWRCHRGLVADDFKADGWQVLHLSAPGARVEEHPYTPAARLVGGELTYAAPPAPQPELF
jgi:uncharacterized protein (DUF488 family)